jgi:CheY-like chemotaxis protein
VAGKGVEPSAGIRKKMIVKRALVVDDSVAARNVLSRQLQEQGLEVDTVESAGEAIDYLCDSSPDVIFMDYEMPGMDGFQALKAIKSNPQTAMIPVLMYTSQEGGFLHVGRARALGAVGVLPKTLEPVGLSKILSDMHLLPDQEAPAMPKIEPETVRDELMIAETGSAVQEVVTEPQATIAKVEQAPEGSQVSGEQIQSVFQDLGRQMGEELELNREILLSRISERREWMWPMVGLFLVLAILLLGMLVIGIRIGDVQQKLSEQPASAPVIDVANEHREPITDEGSVTTQPTGYRVPVVAVQWLVNQNSHFDYGQFPFSDNRIEWLNGLLNQLMRMGYRGEVLLRAHWGRFCEQESGQRQGKLPASDVPLEECTIPESSELPVIYPSVGFSNLMETHPAVDSGQITISLEDAGFASRIEHYPAPERVANAGEWNAIAAANQFIEVVFKGEFTAP